MAPPPPTSITLTVKVPPGHLEGGADHFPLGSVDVSSTIGAIRQQIQSVVPSHPAPEKQRLLYGGRALVDNEQTLADALNTKRDATQTEFVIHLLVKGEGHGSIGAPVAGGAAQGHQRAVFTPAQQQQQLMEERQQSMRNAMLEGQQQQRAQMAQMNLGMGMPLQPGLMPPNPFAGLQQFPGVQMGGMPPQMMGHNFNQVVAQGQQQRAAMGMHGVGQQPAIPQQDGTAATQPQTEGQQPDAQATIPQPLNVNGQPAQQQQHPQGLPRPVSGQGFHFEGIGPNGERVQIHQQVQAFQLPLNGLMPQFGIPQFAAQPQMPFGVAQQQPLPGQGQQSSALDRARDNVAEMRRMLDEMRDASSTTTTEEERRSRIERLREWVQGVHDYIDPLNVHGAATNWTPQTGITGHAPPPQGGLPPPPTNAVPVNFVPNRPFAQPPQLRHMQHVPLQHHQQQARTSDTTCYLLSGPQGPQALLFSPQHGTYTGAFTTGPTGLRPTPTTTAPGMAQQPQQPNPQQQALAQLVQQAVGQNQNQPQNQPLANPAAPQAQAQAGGDPNGPAQAIMNNVWLLFRVLIFVYFVMGSNLGWRRPAALAVIGIGFWMVRAGLFGEGGVARRWWEGVVRVGPAPQGQGGVNGDANAGPGGQAAMPTPEEVARRLIDEQRDQGLGRWREVVRPVERAVALFVASLWPGIGEAHVRDQEREVQRLRDEAEVEARRREEEARKAEDEVKKAEEEKEKSEAAGSTSGKTAPAETTGGSERVAAQAETAAAGGQGKASGSATADGL
ncbi:hypothetical protein LTR15_004152 [Elasticomyces elasticus]|nr:hypothetical protein LTR15_004152 [Elasticomyces elasticus]